MISTLKRFVCPGLPAAVCAWAMLSLPGANAASPDRVPVTVEFRAGLKAVAAMEPDEKIRNPDSLAVHFLPPAFWHYSILSPDFEKSKKFIKFYRVGGYYTVNACTRLIDAVLADMAGRGLAQVIVIGAGFDGRACRFTQKLPGVRFFELDLPVVIARKIEVLMAVLGAVPEDVVYIPFDVRTQGVGAALKKAGYDEKKKSLFIWEGGTSFSEPAAVDGTLRFIAEHSAPGSEVVFDYLPEDVVKGDYSRHRGALFRAVRMKSLGEPWKFGIPEGGAGAFAARFGLQVVSDLGPKELARQYLVKTDGTVDGRPTGYVRILRAVVPK